MYLWKYFFLFFEMSILIYLDIFTQKYLAA